MKNDYKNLYDNFRISRHINHAVPLVMFIEDYVQELASENNILDYAEFKDIIFDREFLEKWLEKTAYKEFTLQDLLIWKLKMVLYQEFAVKDSIYDVFCG